jgi:hypothetical protein
MTLFLSYLLVQNKVIAGQPIDGIGLSSKENSTEFVGLVLSHLIIKEP